LADVQLGGEKAPSIPIQVIDPSFASKPSSCELGAFDTPADSGVNGIMGVMSYVYDCGADCTTTTDLGLYFGCSGSSCGLTTVPLANQAINPIFGMPYDNNGFVVELPSVPVGGSNTESGTVVMGIQTQNNNNPPSLNIVPLNGSEDSDFDGSGIFGTSFAGIDYNQSTVLDTGTFYYSLQSTSNLPDCTQSDLNGFICPTSTQTETAIMESGSGCPGPTVTFQVSTATPTLTITGAIPNLAIDNGSNEDEQGLFVWGLPFFFGRNVYIGLEGRSSTLGAGQYFGF
jgi:hypothetical protein